MIRVALKVLAWLLAGAGVLLAVLMALVMFVDVNLYRNQLERHASAAFGREVVFAGPVSLKPSLMPRVVIEDFRVANPPWASRAHLLEVDRFALRVRLLALLRGRLEVVSVEFHGVDLLLEKDAGGANNFTFGDSNQPAVLPAIERMALYDTVIGYAAAGDPVRSLQLQQVTARNVPGEPLTAELRSRVNQVPVSLSLHAKALQDEDPAGPWQISLLGEADSVSLHADGRVAELTDWSEGEFELGLEGGRLANLGALSGLQLPTAGPFELTAQLRYDLEESLQVSDLAARLGSGDVTGELRWDIDAPRPAIRGRFMSRRLDLNELAFSGGVSGGRDTGSQTAESTSGSDLMLQLTGPASLDFDVEVRVQRLAGLDWPVENIVLGLRADRETLALRPVQGTVAGTRIEASLDLPWGERLRAVGGQDQQAVSLPDLLQDADLALQLYPPADGLRYQTMLTGRPIDLALSGVVAQARPGEALSISVDARVNGKPHQLRLHGEPLAALARNPAGPWRGLALEVEGEVVRVQATGSVARPLEATGFELDYRLSGNDIGMLLPLQGAWSLSGHFADHPDKRVIDKLEARVGTSRLRGRATLHHGGERPRLVAHLEADQVDLDALLPASDRPAAGDTGLDRSFDIGGFAALDLDLELRAGRFLGLARPVEDLVLGVSADRQTLSLAPLRAAVDGTRLEGRMELPWGERLGAAPAGGVSLPWLLQRADLAMQLMPPLAGLRHEAHLLGHPVALSLASLDARARPGEPLELSARVEVQDRPVQVSLRGEPLASLAARPAGPWRELVLEVRGEDTRVRATGRVDRPLEARGFDVDYQVRGAEIQTLLPLFDLILPLEGDYSLSGHFAETPDGAVFDNLSISSGGSDIGGHIRVYRGEPRPRFVAKLHSEQMYLRKLLPVSETEAPPDAQPRVIPDYVLPIERMREIDGELEFKGKRLRTTAGDLGDISFRATLNDGVFRMDPFRVRGWAGARIESDMLIDASQDPPQMNLQWIARELNYGVLLEQAGFAETVEGTIDVTLGLSGTGRTRREFLGDADGQLIVVGQEGRFGSRRLDLWGSALVTTMLSSEWRRDDVTKLNCLVARINIEEGIASSDDLLVDTRRVTIGAAGTLDLETEELNLVFAPRPKRTTLLAVTSPVQVTGTLAAPEVAVTVLPRNRMAAAGGGMLAGLINPAALIFTFSQVGPGEANPCAAAVAEAMAMKGREDEITDLPKPEPERFSFLPGCTRTQRR